MYYEKFHFDCCVYCGEAAEQEEHVFPRSASKYMSDINFLSFVLPSCTDCNVIAGAHVAKTIGDKRVYIHNGIRKKYSKILSIPNWSEKELKGMGDSLRNSIEQGLELRSVIEKRLTWRLEELEDVPTYFRTK